MANYVLKLGGNPIADPTYFDATIGLVQKIINDDPEAKIILTTSALAREEDRTTKLLASMYRDNANNLETIANIHDPLIQHYNLDFDTKTNFRKELNDARTLDDFESSGERIASLLANDIFNSKGFSSEYMDPREFIFTDSTSRNAKIVYVNEKRILDSNAQILIVPGYQGRDPSGHTKTLGRSGTDYTGAELAVAVNAKFYAILKELESIYTADPRLVSSARRVLNLKYSEAIEEAISGMAATHPRAIKTCEDSDMLLLVGSAHDELKNATRITRERFVPSMPIVGITSKKKYNVYSFRKEDKIHPYLDALLAFSKQRVSVDMINTVNGGMSISVDGRNLKREIDFSRTKFLSQENAALVSIVGSLGDSHTFASHLIGKLRENNLPLPSQVYGAPSIPQGQTCLEFIDPEMHAKYGYTIELHKELLWEAKIDLKGIATTVGRIFFFVDPNFKYKKALAVARQFGARINTYDGGSSLHSTNVTFAFNPKSRKEVVNFFHETLF